MKAASRNRRVFIGIALLLVNLPLAAAFGKAPPGRYRISVDGLTVFDVKTGLTWQRGFSSEMYPAKSPGSYCADLGLAGWRDWRIPSKKELETLVDVSDQVNLSPAHATIDVSVFDLPGRPTPKDYFCTSTPYLGFNTLWWVDFAGGNSDVVYFETSRCWLRCVR